MGDVLYGIGVRCAKGENVKCANVDVYGSDKVVEVLWGVWLCCMNVCKDVRCCLVYEKCKILGSVVCG